MVDRYLRWQESLDATDTGVNKSVCAYGAPLVYDPNRFGDVVALGLDETLFYRKGPYHTRQWSTSIVDITIATLLDVVPGRGGDKPKEWIANQTKEWRQCVKWGTLDLSCPYKAVFRAALPNTTLVIDPFHLVKLANKRLDECRRRR
ncbi:MAG: ISL3 family transposase [Ferrimicrobium sp.]